MTMKLKDSDDLGVDKLTAAMFAIAFAWLVFWGGVVYITSHFIRKIW